MEWKKRVGFLMVFPQSQNWSLQLNFNHLQILRFVVLLFWHVLFYPTHPPKKKLTNLSFDMEKERTFIFPPGAKKLERSTKRFGTRKVETRVARVARTSVSLTSQRSLTLAMVTKKFRSWGNENATACLESSYTYGNVSVFAGWILPCPWTREMLRH